MLSGNALHNMLYGGSRSGKTFVIIFCIFIRAFRVKSRHGIFRLNFNHLKTSIWLDTLPKLLSICFPGVDVGPNKTDYYLTLPNGSEIWFCGLDDDKRVEKVLGKEFSSLYFNECSQISYSSIQMAISRLAEKNDLKKKIYYDENPPSKSHWSYWLFIKHLDPIDDEPLSEPEDYACMLMNPEDNIENIDSNYLKILNKMPMKDRERFLLGKFTDVDDGVVYYAFDIDRHVTGVLPGVGTTYIGIDFNVNPMTAVLFSVVNGELHVFDEIYLQNSDTYKMVDELLRKGYRGTVIPDSTGINRKTSGKSDFKILQDAGFLIPHGIRNPFVTDRTNNINRLLTENKIKIDPKCKKLINDFAKVSYKNGKPDQSGTNSGLTHISDAFGYGAWHLFPLNPRGITRTVQL
jgi:PBSX family phage terminase large subunit